MRFIDAVRFLFINRHGELRSGFRAAAFVALTGVAEVLFAYPVGALARILDLQELVVPLLTILATAAGTFVMLRFVNRKRLTAIGLALHPAMVREIGMGLLLGLLMMTGIFLVEYNLGYIGMAWRGMSIVSCLRVIVGSGLLFALAAASEEFLFRGYLFQTLIQAVTFLPAMLLMSVIFGLAHSINPNATAFGLVNVALAGVLLSIAYMKTRSLWLPLSLHFAWNFSQTTVYSFRTSGIEFSGRKLFVLTQAGPEWVTGGAFGPEGGVLATLALLICTGYILKSRLLTEPEGIITLDSIEDLVRPSNGSGGDRA